LDDILNFSFETIARTDWRAYNIFHKVLPAMISGDLKTIGDVIYNYRFNMGSIENCSFVYPKLTELAKKLALKVKDIAEIFSLSSVGPGFFAITENPALCEKEFRKAGLRTIITPLENESYQVIQ